MAAPEVSLSVESEAPKVVTSKQQVTYHVYQHVTTPTGGRNINVPLPKLSILRGTRYLLLALLWCTWALYLAGAATLQSACNQQLGEFFTFFGYVNPATNVNIFGTGATEIFKVDASTNDCVYYYALTWWGVWLQFIAILAASLLLVWHPSKVYTTTVMYFFIMSAVLMFGLANQYNLFLYYMKYKLQQPAASSNYINGASVILAGIVGSLIINFCYIIWNSMIEAEVQVVAEEAAVEAVVEDGAHGKA
jgi:hypothetical protein